MKEGKYEKWLEKETGVPARAESQKVISTEEESVPARS